MLPPPAPGYKWTPLTPEPLNEELEVEFTFIGGPFHEYKSTAKVQAKMTERFTVTMKNEQGKFLYRYSGNDTFTYESQVE